MAKAKATKNKSNLSIYNIKDTFIKIFLEFIIELNKIPNAEQKLNYLRKVLYRNNDNRAEFNIVHGYVIKRILTSPTIKERFLPLESDLEKETITGKQINFPQLDFMVAYGINEKELRPYFEEYIYSEKGFLQKFLVDFINGENVYKIPKDMLKELWDNKRLRVQEYMTLDDDLSLHYHFIGMPPYLYKQQVYKYLDLKSFNNTKFKGLVIPTDVEIHSYFKERNRKARRFYAWQRTLEWDNNDTKYNIRYPCVLYKGSLVKKRKLLYFVRLGSLLRTNIEGMLLNYFETVFKKGFSKRLLFVGYLNEDNSLDIMVMTENKQLTNCFVTEKAFQMNYNYSTLTKDYKKIRKNMEFYADEFNIKKLKLHKSEGFVFHSLHYLLNYMLLNIAQGDKRPLTIMFRNFLMITNGLNIRKALMTRYESKIQVAHFTYLDTKEEFNLHRSRLSETVEIIPNFLNQEVHIFEFERGGRFGLLAPMKSFKFSEESYSEKVSKLRQFSQVFAEKDKF